MMQVAVTYAPSRRIAIVNVDTDDEYVAATEAARYVFETHGYEAMEVRFPSEWLPATASVPGR